MQHSSDILRNRLNICGTCAVDGVDEKKKTGQAGGELRDDSPPRRVETIWLSSRGGGRSGFAAGAARAPAHPVRGRDRDGPKSGLVSPDRAANLSLSVLVLGCIEADL